MASKTARSRGGTPVKENGVKLEEGLNVFKSDVFDPQSYVQNRVSLNEKFISWWLAPELSCSQCEEAKLWRSTGYGAKNAYSLEGECQIQEGLFNKLTSKFKPSM